MSQVAVLALSLLDNSMDVLHSKVFVYKFLVAIETFLADESSFSAWSWPTSQCFTGCGGRFGTCI